MGRLTLNILLSFAEFERSLIVERTRDKMSAARRKGKWVGGIPVLGYDVAPGGGRLIINEDEARQGKRPLPSTRSTVRCFRYSITFTLNNGRRSGGPPRRDGCIRADRSQNKIYKGC